MLCNDLPETVRTNYEGDVIHENFDISMHIIHFSFQKGPSSKNINRNIKNEIWDLG
jgi:hypothetical protein